MLLRASKLYYTLFNIIKQRLIMNQSPLLGGFEHFVLLALSSFPKQAEGMDIYDRLVITTGRDVSVPAVYVTLKRLEQRGLVSSANNRDDGPRRSHKLFQLEPEGVKAVREYRRATEKLWGESRLTELRP